MNHTRNIIIFLLSLICAQAYCQEIGVKSFRLLENDLTANTAGTTVLDQNGYKAALIKIVTTQTGFSFDCGSIGVVKTEQKPSEIWVYVPQGARRITISHPQLGILRDYEFPMTIEKARTYEMILTTDQIQTVVQHNVSAQYLVMHIKPENAIVKIDDIEIPSTNGTVSKLLSYGKHTFSVSDPFYEEKDDTIDISSEKKEISVSLNPAYEIYNISTNPENGSIVVIDDENTFYTTPFKSPRLKKGNHKLCIRLEGYATKEVNLNVNGDGQEHQLVIPLSANFGIITIKSLEGSDIYVNNEYKGGSPWKGRLTEGIYFVEAKLPSYMTSAMDITVKKEDNKEYTIPDPTPIYGSLNINSNPVGADIYIDNIYKGTTPNVISNVLIGKRNVRIKYKSYMDYNDSIVVEESKTNELNIKLRKHLELEYVDLGLSVNWATCNIGANHPWEIGDYFAWGEIEPKKEYTWSNYKFGKENGITKYDYKFFETNLYPEDDVATVNYGESWRIPTFEEIKELIEKCQWEWTSKENVWGYKVKGPNKKSIFIPATGFYIGSEIYGQKDGGYYWSSTLRNDYIQSARSLCIGKDKKNIDNRIDDRCMGFAIRPVKSKNK